MSFSRHGINFKTSASGLLVPATADDPGNDRVDVSFDIATPSDATKFLNGAATPAYAQVKDSDLSLSNITTNDVSSSKHGFAPKGDGNPAHYLDGTGAYSTPTGSGGGDWVKYQTIGPLGSAGAIDFTSIPGTGVAFKIIAELRTNPGSVSVFDASLGFRVNGLSTSIYDYRYIGTSTAQSGSQAQAYIGKCLRYNGGSDFSYAELTCHGYAQSGRRHVLYAMTCHGAGTISAVPIIQGIGSVSGSTAAITQITLINDDPSASSPNWWNVGSYATLWILNG